VTVALDMAQHGVCEIAEQVEPVGHLRPSARVSVVALRQRFVRDHAD
jgi:hypothetical protein